MTIPEPILQLAQMIAGAVIESLVDRGMVADSILQKFGRDPTQRAFAQALARAIDDFRQDYAEWYANLFDESFFRHEAAPLLAEFLLINGQPDSAELARRWATSLAQTAPARAHALTWQCEPAAAAFLESLGDELLAEADLREVHNARHLYDMAANLRALAQKQGIARSTARSYRTYLHWLVDRNRYLDPRGTYQTQRQVQLKLDEVYITLRARPEDQLSHVDRRLLEDEITHLDALTSLSAEQREDRRDELLARRLARERIPPNSAPLDLDQVVNQQSRLVILGDPGSGKTTLLRHLALTQTQALLSGAEPTTARFPIFIRIAAYAEWDEWRQRSLSEYLPHYFDGNECPAVGLADLFATQLAAGGCLLLLDGLDEIVDAGDRRAMVDKLENFVQRHAGGGQRGDNRFVITSRIAGYRSAPVAGSGAPFAHYEVLDLDLPQIERFVNRWCHAVEEAQTPDLPPAARHATAQRENDGILAAVKTTEGVRRLAANPLLLRTLALIHRTGAQLPQRRIELYKLAADTLARTWRPAQQVRMDDAVSKLLDETYLTRLLGKLAYWLHLHKPTGLATEQEVYARLGEEWAAILGRSWDTDEPDPLVLDEVKKFLAVVREHTGLFVERAPKRYGFMHLTFEEYYAARHLVARSRTRTKLIRHHLHDPRWEEPILLALGFVALDAPEDAAELVETAILAQGEEAVELGFGPSAYEELLGRDYLFALRCLGDRIPVRPQTLTQLVNRVRQELVKPTGIAAFQRYQMLLLERVKPLVGSVSAQALAKALMQDLRDADADARRRAIVGLSQLKNFIPAVVDGLLAILSDNTVEADIRRHAAEGLGQVEIGTASIAEGLLAVLIDDDVLVSWRAAKSLGQLGSRTPSAVEGLLAALHDDNANVSSNAAVGLGYIGSGIPAVVEGLLAALRNADAYTSSSVATSLGRLSNEVPAVVEGLLTALRDTDAYVRKVATIGLGQVGGNVSGVVESLLTALTDANTEVRISAVTSLGQMGNRSSTVVEGLLTALHDPNANMRSSAAASLGQVGISEHIVIEGLLTALRDPNANVRSSAAASLGRLGRGVPAVVNGLLIALYDANVNVRRRAVTSLGEVRIFEPNVIEALLIALGDPNANVCFDAATSLVQLGGSLSAVIPVWLEALQQSENIFNRQRSAQLLGEHGNADNELITILFHSLLDQDNRVRSACSTALARLTKRFPNIKLLIEQLLVAAISDSQFEGRDRVSKRTGQDYAYEALWQVMN